MRQLDKPAVIEHTEPVINTLFSVAGFCILFFRLKTPKANLLTAQPETQRSLPVQPIDDELAIVIPARNEALRIRPCLESLKDLPSHWKVIIVDDESQDDTAKIVGEYKTISLIAKQSPALQLGSVSGKCAACQRGAETVLNFKWILFTDADTIHSVEQLSFALKTAAQNQMDLVTSLPYYLTPTTWEKILGPFYSWITLITNAYGTPRVERLYANGQFLLFRAAAYRQLGGHRSVDDHLAEDLTFAKKAIAQNLKFGVLNPACYAVRMYATWPDFYRGWRRLYQIGFKFTSAMAALEIFLAMAALLLFLHPNAFSVAISAASFFLLWKGSRHVGKFPGWSLIFSPLTIPLFLIISVDAGLRRILRRAIIWRTRSYAN